MRVRTRLFSIRFLSRIFFLAILFLVPLSFGIAIENPTAIHIGKGIRNLYYQAKANLTYCAIQFGPSVQKTLDLYTLSDGREIRGRSVLEQGEFLFFISYQGDSTEILKVNKQNVLQKSQCQVDCRTLKAQFEKKKILAETYKPFFESPSVPSKKKEPPSFSGELSPEQTETNEWLFKIAQQGLGTFSETMLQQLKKAGIHEISPNP